MNDTTQTEAFAVSTRATNSPKAKRPGKRRMARTPKPDTMRSEAPAQAAKPNPERGPSKIASVIALLERPEGATLNEMVEATGWLPHSTRAALTGLKKKGHTITKDRRGDVTCYCSA
jgi:hypothetical protein